MSHHPTSWICVDSEICLAIPFNALLWLNYLTANSKPCGKRDTPLMLFAQWENFPLWAKASFISISHKPLINSMHHKLVSIMQQALYSVLTIKRISLWCESWPDRKGKTHNQPSLSFHQCWCVCRAIRELSNQICNLVRLIEGFPEVRSDFWKTSPINECPFAPILHSKPSELSMEK